MSSIFAYFPNALETVRNTSFSSLGTSASRKSSASLGTKTGTARSGYRDSSTERIAEDASLPAASGRSRSTFPTTSYTPRLYCRATHQQHKQKGICWFANNTQRELQEAVR